MSKDKPIESPEEIAARLRKIILELCPKTDPGACDKMLFSTLPDISYDDFNQTKKIVKEMTDSRPQYKKLSQEVPNALDGLREIHENYPKIQADTKQIIQESQTKWQNSVNSSRNEKRCIVM